MHKQSLTMQIHSDGKKRIGSAQGRIKPARAVSLASVVGDLLEAYEINNEPFQ